MHMRSLSQVNKKEDIYKIALWIRLCIFLIVMVLLAFVKINYKLVLVGL